MIRLDTQNEIIDIPIIYHVKNLSILLSIMPFLLISKQFIVLLKKIIIHYINDALRYFYFFEIQKNIIIKIICILENM